MNRVRSLLLLLVCAGSVSMTAASCKSKHGGSGTPTPTPSPDTLQVLVTGSDGLPAAGVTVMLQSSSGALLSTLFTNTAGVVTATGVADGSMITVGFHLAGQDRVRTIAGVTGTDSIHVRHPFAIAPPNDPIGSMTIHYATFSPGAGYSIDIPCGSISTGQTNAVASFTSQCVSDTQTVDFIGLASSSGTYVAYFLEPDVPFADAGTVNAPPWQPYATYQRTFTDPPAGVTNVSLSLGVQLASARFGLALVGQPPAPTMVFSTQTIPFAALPDPQETITTSVFDPVTSVQRESAFAIFNSGAFDQDLASQLLPMIASASIDTSNGFTVLVATSSGGVGAATGQFADFYVDSTDRPLVWEIISAPGSVTLPTLGGSFSVPSAHGLVTLVDVEHFQSTQWADYAAFRSDAPRFTSSYGLPTIDGRHRLSLWSAGF